MGLVVLLIFLVVCAIAFSFYKSAKKKNDTATRSQDAPTVLTPEEIEPNESASEFEPFAARRAEVKSVPSRPTEQFKRTAAHQEMKPRVTTPEENMRPTIKSALTVTTVRGTGHHDEFCTVEHSRKDLYRVEKGVPVTHSIGGKSTEGCDEHYDARFVKLDDSPIIRQETLSRQDLIKAVVLGEVVNRPAFKRGARTR